MQPPKVTSNLRSVMSLLFIAKLFLFLSRLFRLNTLQHGRQQTVPLPFLVSDARLFTMPCRSVRPLIRHYQPPSSSGACHSFTSFSFSFFSVFLMISCPFPHSPSPTFQLPTVSPTTCMMVLIPSASFQPRTVTYLHPLALLWWCCVLLLHFSCLQ